MEKDDNEYMKNILLLSMSTLNRNLKVNKYIYSASEREIYGISQLEPITKFLITNMNVKLEKVVIMASDDAIKPDKNYKISACDFYLARIYNYLKDKKKQISEDIANFENADYSKIVVEQSKTTIKEINYSNEHSGTKYKLFGIEFVIVPMKEELISFFFDVIDQIQSTDGTKLYMDMQGGDRNAIAQMNAIVGLLEGENVEIAGRYAMGYHADQEFNPIKEVSSNYSTYALISAMQAFKKYGRGQSLIEYFKKNDNEFVQKLLQAIKTASDSIRLCDIDGFDNALQIISDLRPSFRTLTNTEIDIVYKDIVEDYGDMLLNTHGGYLRKIEWCIKKGYIQQALTIVESKMPEYLFDKGVIIFEWDKIVKAENGEKKDIKTWFDDDIYKKDYQSLKHFAVEILFFNNWYSKSHFGVVDRFDNVEDLLNEFYDDRVNWVRFNKKRPNQVTIIPSIVPSCKKYLSAFMKLHCYLKEQRNIVNHGSSSCERKSIKELTTKLEMYVELGRKIINE